MMKKYITPSIFVGKMDVTLLIETSKIPFVTGEPKPLDGKAFFYDIDEDDMETEWECSAW